MQLLHLLSLTLLTTLSAQAGYFPSFTLINKDQILTPKSIAIVAGGLGIWGLGCCVKDLWKVSSALYQGDEGIAALKVSEMQKLRRHQIHDFYSRISMLYPENSPLLPATQNSKKFTQMNMAMNALDQGKHTKALAQISLIKDETEQKSQIDEYWKTHFIPARKNAITTIKNDYKWRAAKDISIMAAVGMVGYGAYTLINK